MRRLLLLLLLPFVIPVFAQDSLYQKKEFTYSPGQVLPYRILFPEGYDRTRAYPLLLFLHGAGERGTDNERQLIHGGKLFSSAGNRSRYPAIVVLPRDEWWAALKPDTTRRPLGLAFDYTTPARWPLQAVAALLQQLVREEGVDARRIYVSGLSMGGMGTFELVSRYPTVFAAALPICGGGDTLYRNRQLRRVPFWIFHGDADRVVDVRYSRAMEHHLRSLGAPVRYTEYPGVGHNSWDPAFAEPDYLDWMFGQRRSRKARF